MNEFCTETSYNHVYDFKTKIVTRQLISTAYNAGVCLINHYCRTIPKDDSFHFIGDGKSLSGTYLLYVIETNICTDYFCYNPFPPFLVLNLW